MSLDSGLSADGYIFLEAIANDKGVHEPTAAWWLSPDIKLNPSTTHDVAQVGRNDLKIRVHKHNFTPPGGAWPDTTWVKVDVYVCLPVLNQSPVPSDATVSKKLTNVVDQSGTITNPVSTTLGAIPLDTPTTIPSAGLDVNVPWVIAAGTPSTAPDGPGGHRCLIARCYAKSSGAINPDTGDFHLPDDPHVAQHNICIVYCSSPCGLEVWTTHTGKETERITLTVTPDLDPADVVLNAAFPLLRAEKQFERLVTQPPPFEFNLDLGKFTQVRSETRVSEFTINRPRQIVIDRTRNQFVDQLTRTVIQPHIETRPIRRTFFRTVVGSILRRPIQPIIPRPRPITVTRPVFEAEVTMKPGEVSSFNFATDMEKANYGDAHIFHLRHIASNKRVLGGLTVIAVRVK